MVASLVPSLPLQTHHFPFRNCSFPTLSFPSSLSGFPSPFPSHKKPLRLKTAPSASTQTGSPSTPSGSPPLKAAKYKKPLEEIYNVRVERGVSEERLKTLGVDRWSTWVTGRCRLPWNWDVDQQVYIVKGTVKVVPGGCGERCMRFEQGDLVRYPKWFEADLYFEGPYEERYRFRAYGED